MKLANHTRSSFNNLSKTILDKAAKIKLVIFDVDGVLTDGRVYFGSNDVEYQAFHIHDGLGLKLLQNSGVTVGIITGRNSVNVARRAKELGIELLYQGQSEKEPAYETLLNQLQLSDEQVAYAGDDLPDLPLIHRAGLGIAVANAVSIVREFADWQTETSGGQGAVREICELIMYAQQTLSTTIASLLPKQV